MTRKKDMNQICRKERENVADTPIRGKGTEEEKGCQVNRALRNEARCGGRTSLSNGGKRSQ